MPISKNLFRPRAWDNAGLRPVGGGHWDTATNDPVASSPGPRLIVISEPIDRSIAEKLVGLTIMVVCDNDFGMQVQNAGSGKFVEVAELQRDFNDVCVGIIGCGGAATAFARLLRNFEIGLLVHEPNLPPQQVHELGAEFCDDVRTVVDQADVVIMFPYKNPQRPAPGAELWSEQPAASRLIIVNETLLTDGLLSRFRGLAYVGNSTGVGNSTRKVASYTDSPTVRLLSGFNHPLPNSLSRIGREVVEAIYRHMKKDA